MRWFYKSRGYLLIKDIIDKAYNIEIKDRRFSFLVGDGTTQISIIGANDSFEGSYIGVDGILYDISNSEFFCINDLLLDIVTASIKKKIGCFKLDDDIQKAINDTAKIQEAHAQIEFLTKEVNRIKSSYS